LFRPGSDLLTSFCTDLDLVKRFRELEFRSSKFLEVKQEILPDVEQSLLPGKAKWEVKKTQENERKKDDVVDYEEAEL
jgi:hypothetical protein